MFIPKVTRRRPAIARSRPAGSVGHMNNTGIDGSAGGDPGVPPPSSGVWKPLGGITPSNIRVPDWTEIVKSKTYRFDVPPGTTFRPIEWRQLTIGTIYAIRFNFTGTMAPPGGCFFRPGDFADDTDLDTEGVKTIIFEAQDTNGWARIAHEDITGVKYIVVSDLNFWEFFPA